MPYIRLSIAQKLTPEKQEELSGAIGEALATIPGKDGRGLIVDMEDGKTMFVGGKKNENVVFIDVRYYSNFPYTIKSAFTTAVFEVVTRVIGTPKESAFLTITEYNGWGGFGNYKDEYYSD